MCKIGRGDIVFGKWGNPMKEADRQELNWFKKHTDTVLILGSILGAMVWMNGKFNDMEMRLVKIETVMIMKGIMPTELAVNPEEI